MPVKYQSDVLYASISGASSGNNTLIAAASGLKIRVISLAIVAASAVTVRFQSGASGTALSGIQSLITGTPYVLPYNPAGHFETAVNTLLNMSLGGAVQVSGHMTYVLVEA